MAVKVGDRFGLFTVIRTAADAANRWSSYHHCCNAYTAMQDGIEKDILGACLDDEYAEMKADPYIMGVGLYTYQQSLRAQ